MDKETRAQEICRSVFQNKGEEAVSQAYTAVWIRLINRLEREKAQEAVNEG